MLKNVMAAVEAFHTRVGVSEKTDWHNYRMDISLKRDHREAYDQLRFACLQMQTSALLLEEAAEKTEDPRVLRLHLIMEEAAETMKAMCNNEPVDTLDGLCDLIYVCVGTAVQFGWDIDEAFRRVHDSNMTKLPSGVRCRDKGAEYVPANLEDLV